MSLEIFIIQQRICSEIFILEEEEIVAEEFRARNLERNASLLIKVNKITFDRNLREEIVSRLSVETSKRSKDESGKCKVSATIREESKSGAGRTGRLSSRHG